ncbi:hypothetical protein DL96DRAFT_1584850 [Flagelloscypha sp. PMI_526]|nr:hypothetical protein DL96DRAFT_1584850 [Flagelloscypha sp. PMI_526]
MRFKCLHRTNPALPSLLGLLVLFSLRPMVVEATMKDHLRIVHHPSCIVHKADYHCQCIEPVFDDSGHIRLSIVIVCVSSGMVHKVVTRRISLSHFCKPHTPGLSTDFSNHSFCQREINDGLALIVRRGGREEGFVSDIGSQG